MAQSSRQTEKAKAKARKDLYFLVEWQSEDKQAEDSERMFDVLPSKALQAEDSDVLDVAVDTVGKANFKGKLYPVKIVGKGDRLAMKSLQDSMELGINSNVDTTVEEGGCLAEHDSGALNEDNISDGEGESQKEKKKSKKSLPIKNKRIQKKVPGTM